jgi:hypothetical protein
VTDRGNMEGKEKEKGKRKAKVKKKEKDAGGLSGLNEKLIVLFLLEFMVVSAVFLGLWYYIGESYQSTVFFFAKYILLLMGYDPLQISAVNLSRAYLGNFNLVPLVALAIATPKLAMKRRIEMLAIGIPLLFLLHVLDLVAHFPLYFHGSEIARVVVYSIGVGGVALPFIIWFILCYQEFSSGSSL